MTRKAPRMSSRAQRGICFHSALCFAFPISSFWFPRIDEEEESRCPGMDSESEGPCLRSRCAFPVHPPPIRGTCRPWDHGRLGSVPPHPPIPPRASGLRERIEHLPHPHSGGIAFGPGPYRARPAPERKPVLFLLAEPYSVRG